MQETLKKVKTSEAEDLKKKQQGAAKSSSLKKTATKDATPLKKEDSPVPRKLKLNIGDVSMDSAGWPKELASPPKAAAFPTQVVQEKQGGKG